MTDIGCIVLTMGNRPELLDRALRSILSQQGVSVDVVVVGNGWEPTDLPAGVRGVGLPDNIGIPAGRNAGVPHVEGALVFFLDDDAALSGDDVVAKAAGCSGSRPTSVWCSCDPSTRCRGDAAVVRATAPRVVTPHATVTSPRLGRRRPCPARRAYGCLWRPEARLSTNMKVSSSRGG